MEIEEEMENNWILVRGGGDIATGTIYKLCKCGFRVLVSETEHPSAIRRHVAFSEAVYQGEMKVEDMTAVLVQNWNEACNIMEKGQPAVIVDPNCLIIKEHRPMVLVDAILAKKNLGTNRSMAQCTIALGPGFEAGVDVDYVIETKRGHNLGRIIKNGSAAPNTGIPGIIGGYGKERVIHAQTEGRLYSRAKISDFVEKDEVIAVIEAEQESIFVRASITGILRGLIRDGYPVTKGFKIADIDPRESERENCFTISDKARCIAGGVLEAILSKS